MSNIYFDWPARDTADRFIKFDTVRSADVNDAFDLVSAGFEKFPAPGVMWGGKQGYGVAGGSVDAWTVSIASSYLTSYEDALTVRVKFPAANTITNPTLNLNGLGLKIIADFAGAPIAAGDISANCIATLVYNETLGKWQIASQEQASLTGVSTLSSKSADYTFVLSDADNNFLHPSADVTPRTWTIPANASVPYPINTVLMMINQNAAGAISIAITTDTLRFAGDGTTGTRTLAANGIATALKITATEWLVSGVGLT